LRVVVVAVGKIKERGLRELVDDYEKRIGRYARFEEIELADGPNVEAKMLRAVPERSRVIALEVDGARVTSEGLAKMVGQCETGAVPAIVFLIGGAYGLPPSVSKSAAVRLSLSDMIFPHRLARLILVEQIYRAFTILRNEPYSHA
jgi:23S rRNA (pseudouridine1915-N3)-methyltransferase